MHLFGSVAVTIFWFSELGDAHRIWDQYALPEADDELIPEYGRKVDGFWDISNNQNLAQHQPSAASIEDDVETRLVMETVKLPYAAQALASMISANYFEIDVNGDFSSSKTSVLSCLSAKASSDERIQLLARVVHALLSGKTKRKALGHDMILLMAEKKLLRVRLTKEPNSPFPLD